MLNRIIKRNLFLIVLFCVFIILCLFIKYNFSELIIKTDKIVKDFVDNHMIYLPITKSMKLITNLASVVGVLTIFVLSIIFFKDKIIRLTLFCNMGLIGFLSFILKLLFSRTRPLISIIKMPKSYSFPSGHTFFAVGFFGLIVYFIIKSNINKNIKIFLIPIIILTISLIGISRIYLGVHHFTDVVGGLILGVIILLISINTYQVIKEE